MPLLGAKAPSNVPQVDHNQQDIGGKKVGNGPLVPSIAAVGEPSSYFEDEAHPLRHPRRFLVPSQSLKKRKIVHGGVQLPDLRNKKSRGLAQQEVSLRAASGTDKPTEILWDNTQKQTNNGEIRSELKLGRAEEMGTRPGIILKPAEVSNVPMSSKGTAVETPLTSHLPHGTEIPAETTAASKTVDNASLWAGFRASLSLPEEDIDKFNGKCLSGTGLGLIASGKGKILEEYMEAAIRVLDK